jgi:hypothetical protein
VVDIDVHVPVVVDVAIDVPVDVGAITDVPIALAGVRVTIPQVPDLTTGDVGAVCRPATCRRRSISSEVGTVDARTSSASTACQTASSAATRTSAPGTGTRTSSPTTHAPTTAHASTTSSTPTTATLTVRVVTDGHRQTPHKHQRETHALPKS